MTRLNATQQAAVSASPGPVLVLAGAGSGKTRVIVERMAWLVEEEGVSPRNLLALTFTNKAAGEMRMRFARRLGVETVPAFIGTFHSFGLWVLRREAGAIDRSKNFTIFDDADQLSLMKRLVKDLPKNFVPVSPRDALRFISQIKQIEPYPAWSDPPESLEEGSFRELWTRYHDTLKGCSALDFDDLTALTAHLFSTTPEVCEHYRMRFNHVLIDEYQDTNRSQYVIARSLGLDSSLFVVGDEDQSIYSWRGADINNILDFVKDFPNAQAFRLEENYRSTQKILDAANAVVANNVNRLGKTLYTRQEEGTPVRCFSAETAEEEADFIAQDILKRELPVSQVAIFYRVHTLARLMEESLRQRRVPYVVVGGIKFYSRREIKDILAYLRLAANPLDDESLRRVLNVPARGIGNTTRERLEDYARLRNQPLLQVLRESEYDQSLPARARSSAATFVELIDFLASRAKDTGLAEVVELLLDRIGYRDYVRQSDEREFQNRIEIIEEFVVSCKQYDSGKAGGLEGFLQDLALQTDADQWDADGGAVTLMTCHSAKGLEFDHVYLLGMEEDLFPMTRFDDDDDDMEEERRLCYVAMTRTRKTLTLTHSGSRMVYGVSHNRRTPSRFLGEAGMHRLQPVDYSGEAKAKRQNRNTKSMPATPPPVVESSELRSGTAVRHARFGRGVVLYTKGVGDKLTARVRFETGRVAMLLVAKAPLEIVSKR